MNFHRWVQKLHNWRFTCFCLTYCTTKSHQDPKLYYIDLYNIHPPKKRKCLIVSQFEARISHKFLTFEWLSKQKLKLFVTWDSQKRSPCFLGPLLLGAMPLLKKGMMSLWEPKGSPSSTSPARAMKRNRTFAFFLLGSTSSSKQFDIHKTKWHQYDIESYIFMYQMHTSMAFRR